MSCINNQTTDLYEGIRCLTNGRGGRGWRLNGCGRNGRPWRATRSPNKGSAGSKTRGLIKQCGKQPPPPPPRTSSALISSLWLVGTTTRDRDLDRRLCWASLRRQRHQAVTMNFCLLFLIREGGCLKRFIELPQPQFCKSRHVPPTASGPSPRWRR